MVYCGHRSVPTTNVIIPPPPPSSHPHTHVSAEQFADAPVVRTRDPAVLADLDIIVDVGGVYDPETHRYDHHQRGFEEFFDENHSTKVRG